MPNDSAQEIVVRFSAPVKISALLIAASSAVLSLPVAVRAIPQEAFGPLFVFLAFPAGLAYLALVVFARRLRVTADRIAAEGVPNPFWPSFECRFADMTGIQKEGGWSSLAVYKFMKTNPLPIANLELLDRGPAELLEEVRQRVPAEKFIEPVPSSLRSRWTVHRWNASAAILLAAAWISLQLLEAGPLVSFEQTGYAFLDSLLLTAGLILGFGDFLLLQFINRHT
ncbi:MAG: hypothetical protein JW929_11665 [Anaerolineales bacterium]|nr:hypothetical protein [Anaerolineales bacterium]